MAQIYSKDSRFLENIRLLASQNEGGSRVGGILQLYFILGPKGILDNFFVRQVGMLKQEAGPKAT
jgi:hypothetical protein